MARTIHFNTGRSYTVHGQRITATLHDDGVVTFYDHDRMVDGEFVFGSPWRDIERGDVMTAYDRYLAPNSARSHVDGLQRGGCNSVYVE